MLSIFQCPFHFSGDGDNRSTTAANASSWALRRQSRLFSSEHYKKAYSVDEEPLPQQPRRRAFAAIALTEDFNSTLSTTPSESKDEIRSLSFDTSRSDSKELNKKGSLDSYNLQDKASIKAESSIEKEDEEPDEGGNEAEDEDDEVFAAASRTRRRSRVPSNSFEITTTSYNRNRQLKLLRTVHSAQARLQKNNKHRNLINSSLKTPSIVLSVDEIEEPIKHPNYKNRINSPSPSLKVEVDEEDFYRLGGRRLSKLESQTFDYTDEPYVEEEETSDLIDSSKPLERKMKSSLSFKKEHSFSTTFTNFASSFLPSRLLNRHKSSSSDQPLASKTQSLSSSERPLDFVEW
ncbi:unnamed protein product [Lepeophtheirus salmonis]|uniref:(salmon louse) hypothetical protein n=1 Tax=Lepeophtheirus salmonis TaxID=72036 RepID=A0A7R8D2D6_LEPSM|nr:unnamed protein product [Lepeophtheirus salmonis]CAF3002039.1 unnamed protein product [Lepeophtheirus salmonis]